MYVYNGAYVIFKQVTVHIAKTTHRQKPLGSAIAIQNFFQSELKVLFFL